MSTKGRITYRFDKQSGARLEPKKEENKPASQVVPYFQEELKFTSEIGPWNSPFQNDAHALEQLIREADGQTTKNAREAAPAETGRRKAADPIDLHPEEFEQPDAILLGDEYEYEYEKEYEATPKRIQAGPKVIDMYPLLDPELDERERRKMDGADRASIGSYMTGVSHRPSKGPSWFKVFASVTGAIATGALFGYFVLALFTSGGGQANTDSTSNQPGTTVSGAITDGTDKTKDDAASPDAPAGQTEGSTDGTANKGGTTNDGASQAEMIQVDIPASSYYMLQYGVFSNKEGLDAAVNELGDKGLAAASLTTADDYRVYVGMSADKDQATLLGQLLDNMDVYVKQIDLPAVSSISFKGEASAVESFFQQTSELIGKLDGLTIDRLSAGGGAKDDGEWKELHQQWISAASAMEAGLTDKVSKSTLQRLTQTINSVAVAADEYAKKPSDAYLWSMQSSLMKAVFAEKAWFESMDAL
ncbi:SPOR domain-containing protein [Paenibacillus silvisoli]|uniref:SPOR domain-containing protein n=1 Tax=Paenibacillus silvisoli TaxID=3110539 RepID=UPI00280479CD|nr:SPOR domain-containing protein [Paenibacillus silvisoli]